ncbi:esterase/lipase family protein [Luteimonas changyuni]|uniref:esterase/lipase family protein n=1 Tax=Luteimonas sp. MJ145 TaxID=3129234 RepID=UPI0031BB0AC7
MTVMHRRAPATSPAHRAVRALALASCLLLLGGCAILKEFAPRVEAQQLGPGEYIAIKRSDILTTDELSPATQATLRVAGLDDNACLEPPAPACMVALAKVQGLTDERRLASLAELWTQQAIALTPVDSVPAADAQVDAWLEAARHAYAYLFFSERAPGERAFEDRQTQVRDYYNYAVQQAAAGLFERWQVLHADNAAAGDAADGSTGTNAEGRADTDAVLSIAGWTIRNDMSGVRMPEGVELPKELVPASSISFAGLRSIYRRDGFGAEMVAVMGDDPVTTAATPVQVPDPASIERNRGDGPDRRRANRPRPYSEMPSPTLTLLIRFPGDDLASVLSTRELLISGHDPYVEEAIDLHGLHVPLSANYSAGYGLWLARSGFNRQSLQTLFGREQGITRPHLYLMQPYDPDRRILLMIHGLASSPEAWVNVANEVLGDDVLRREFQIWQVYYPTNMPLVLNQSAIRRIIVDAVQHFDPEGSARASHGTVLIGHSMGGVLSRLLVSSADDQLWTWAHENYELDDGRMERIGPRLDRMLRFEPLPGVGRVVFIASPHRGTKVAGNRLGRLVGKLVRLPLAVLEEVGELLVGDDGTAEPIAVPNSIENLSENDPFVRAAADLPISPGVQYHSIIAQADPTVPLEESDDGLVPYPSAHLPGALSEKVIIGGHSIQESAPAILEIRRILHRDIRELTGPLDAGGD